MYKSNRSQHVNCDSLSKFTLIISPKTYMKQLYGDWYIPCRFSPSDLFSYNVAPLGIFPVGIFFDRVFSRRLFHTLGLFNQCSFPADIFSGIFLNKKKKSNLTGQFICYVALNIIVACLEYILFFSEKYVNFISIAGYVYPHECSLVITF